MNTPLILAALLCISTSACAVEPRVINIPPGELATALEAVARQSDVELIFQPDQLKDIHTDGVVGMLTARQATEKLLEGTHLQLRTDPENGAMMIGAAAATGESSPGANPGTAALTPEEEVIVTARRAQLKEMREEMVRLQDRFYTEYNRLNSNHWWDVVCRWKVMSGHLKVRDCRPRYIDQAQTVSTSPFAGGGDAAPKQPPPPYQSTVPPLGSSRAIERWEQFEKNLHEQIDKSPELRRLLNERVAAEERYEAARKQKFDGKVIVLD